MEPTNNSVVTAIEPQQRDPDRVSIFIDGHFAIGVHEAVLAKVRVRVGEQVSLEQLQTLARAEEKRRARDAALVQLGVRARSRRELERWLQRHGYDAEVVAEVLDDLGRWDLIDDAQFARRWVEGRTGRRKPLGPDRLAAELRQKGVEREVIDSALEAIDPETELALALTAGRQKVESIRGEAVPIVRRKLAAALRRRGFSWNTITRVSDILLAEEDDSEAAGDA